MPSSLTAAALIGGGLGLAGSVLGSNEQSDAIEGAANTSAASSKYAADLQKEMYDQTRADQTPWRAAGGNALQQMSYGMGLPTQQDMAYQPKSDAELRAMFLPTYTTGAAGGEPGTVDEAKIAAAIADYKKGARPFVGDGQSGDLSRDFSMADFEKDPGYEFRMNEGVKALDRSASRGGQLLSGAALKGLSRFGQELGSQEYGNAFNRYQSNQTNKFNRLATIAGVGQTANNALAQAGSSYAANAGNITMQNGDNQATLGLMGGQSRATMYQGGANALMTPFAYGGTSGSSSSMQNFGNMLGGNFGASGAWTNPDTGSLFKYS